jgi:hypothetical protein
VTDSELIARLRRTVIRDRSYPDHLLNWLRAAADTLETRNVELAELRRNTGHLPGPLVAKILAHWTTGDTTMLRQFTDDEIRAAEHATFEVTEPC